MHHSPLTLVAALETALAPMIELAQQDDMIAASVTLEGNFIKVTSTSYDACETVEVSGRINLDLQVIEITQIWAPKGGIYDYTVESEVSSVSFAELIERTTAHAVQTAAHI